jgi:V-type H+-transporting ATPase subunit H
MVSAKDRERLLEESQAQQDSQGSSVLQQTVTWDSYEGASLISKKELNLIRRFDKQSFEVQHDLLSHDGAAYAELFLSMLKNISQDNVPHYVLSMLDKALIEEPSFAQSFAPLLDNATLNPFSVLFRLVNRGVSDDVIVSKSCHVAYILLNEGLKASAEDASSFVSWLSVQLTNKGLQNTAVQVFACLQGLLRSPEFRHVFGASSSNIERLEPLLELQQGEQPNLQLLYQVTNCLWILSYTKGVQEKLIYVGLIRNLVNLLKVVTKEKVIRMCLATLRNLVEFKACKSYLMEMSALKVLSHVEGQGWADEEIVDDLKVLNAKLEQNIQFLSTFDEYRKEVIGGQLEWSPAHRSLKFWNENVHKFEEKNFELVRMLANILKPGSGYSSRQVAIAAHDIGQFVVHYPRGKSIVNEMGCKVNIMMLLTNDNEEVTKEALLTVQKMMIHS